MVDSLRRKHSLGFDMRRGLPLTIAIVGGLTAEVSAQTRPLGAADAIALPQLAEVSLAPDGMHVAYAVRRRDLDDAETVQSFWSVATAGGVTDSLPIDHRASNLRWRPDGASLSYLAPDENGTIQVWAHEAGIRPFQLTTHRESISSFEWSPSSRRLAFTSSIEVPVREAEEGAGVVIDRDRFTAKRLFSGKGLGHRDAHYGDPPLRSELWIHEITTGHTRLVSGELSVGAYAWSPDGEMLAITAHGDLGRLPAAYARYDLLLHTVGEARLDTLEAGAGGDYFDGTVAYDDPFWSPDGSRIGYFRRDWRDRWESSPQLGVFLLAERRTIFVMPDEDLETYHPRAFWLHPDTVLLENTYRAGRRLFAVALSDKSVRAVVDSEDWFDQHAFSKDGRVVAFVRERIDMPAELYVADRAMREPRQLTNLHGSFDRLSSPKVERLSWTAHDGAEVEGWLYLPAKEPPFPTIVFVHGGPTWVYPNRFEPYVPYWPYAFSIFAARGIAILIPNYRGNASYGKSFRERSALDAEPIDDIIAGVDLLVGRGIADPARLGIAGHSHGCSLGPLIAARYRRFLVGACAEGTANWTSQYARNLGWMNSEIVDHYWGHGRSPYQAPDDYRRLSAVYWFEGLRTAFLFEAGERASVLSGVQYAMAALRADVPHELVIYKDTDHNVTDPRVMLEVMQRNLEWFEFWLLGREYRSGSKRGQYDRWRRLREDVRRGTG